MQMNPFTGKTIRWSFTGDPMPGAVYENIFHGDGSVTWRIVEGEFKGATRTERQSSVLRIDDHCWAVSYLAASGHTLTVVLNLANGQAVGFASNEKTWAALRGQFEILP